MAEYRAEMKMLEALMDKDLKFSTVILQNQFVLQLLLQAIETAKAAADLTGAPFMIFDATVQILQTRIKENNHLLGVRYEAGDNPS